MMSFYLKSDHPLFDKYQLFLTQLCEEIIFADHLEAAIHTVLARGEAISNNEYHILFPNPEKEISLALQSHFIAHLYQKRLEMPVHGVKAKLHFLLCTHFRQYPYMAKILQKIAHYHIARGQIGFLYQNAFDSMSHLWSLIQDSAVDFNFYSKRLLLTNIYIETIFYAAGDDSENLSDTDAFIRRQFDKISVIETVKKKFNHLVCFVQKIIQK